MESLFMKGDLYRALELAVQQMLDEVHRWDPDQLLTQSENEIALYLAKKYDAQCPVLKGDEMYASEPEDVAQVVQSHSRRPVRVPGTRITVHVPFEGERMLFFQKPSSYTLSPPQARITDDELILVFEDRHLDAARVRDRVENELREIERWLTSVRQMTEHHNASLPETALNAVRTRKEKLLADRRTVAGLGLPVRRRGDAPSFAVPVQRRRPRIVRSPAPSKTLYEPEPTLSGSDYEEALRTIINGGRQLERSPSTTHRLGEEERRDLLLVALNAQFEGQAGGEVFNGAGKTDILLRVENRNVFIAECKIWRGSKAFTKAIDQLLGYLVWRDTKAVIVLFIEAKDATAVIEKARSEMEAHARCIRAMPASTPEERSDFVLLADGDPAREIHLALLPFVIGPAEANLSEGSR